MQMRFCMHYSNLFIGPLKQKDEMRKKFMLTLMITMTLTISMAGQNIRYRGFADMEYGLYIANNIDKAGFMFGTSTTHGIQVTDGLFVGGGLNIGIGSYADIYYDSGYWFEEEDDWDTSVAVTLYAAGRYEFIHNRKVSPYVDLRLGGGFLDSTDEGTLYLSPTVGVTINFTKNSDWMPDLHIRFGQGNISMEMIFLTD